MPSTDGPTMVWSGRTSCGEPASMSTASVARCPERSGCFGLVLSSGRKPGLDGIEAGQDLVEAVGLRLGGVRLGVHVAGERRLDRSPGDAQFETHLPEHRSRESVRFGDQAEEQVLTADVVVEQFGALMRCQFQRPARVL